MLKGINGNSDFPTIEDRISKRIPIKTAEDEQYVRERFYWVVDKFSQEYFIRGGKINIDEFFNRMFQMLRVGIKGLDLRIFFDFQLGIANSWLHIANERRFKLKVSDAFFIDQFLQAVDRRFSAQTLGLFYNVPYFLKALTGAGEKKDKALETIVAAVELAETFAYYQYPLEEYLLKIIETIAIYSEKNGIQVTKEMFICDALGKKLTGNRK
jgi:hypothetical protein